MNIKDRNKIRMKEQYCSHMIILINIFMCVVYYIKKDNKIFYMEKSYNNTYIILKTHTHIYKNLHIGVLYIYV